MDFFTLQRILIKFGALIIMFGKFLPSSASATINRSEIDRHIHLKYRLLKNKLAKGFQTNEEERRSILQLVIDSADNFIKKAGVVRCLLSKELDGNDLCTYDIMCSMKHDAPRPPLEDLDAILFYKAILQQFSTVSQSVIAREKELDRVDIYRAMLEYQDTFTNLIATLAYAAGYFDGGSSQRSNTTLPDIFFPFPSNDRCVLVENLSLDAQKFRAIKSIWLFGYYLRANIHERCSPYYNLLLNTLKVLS